jgi:uncharacterized membrane protein
MGGAKPVHLQVRGGFVIFWGIILVILGFIMIINPTLVWNITQKWKTDDGTEPSRLYIASTRFGGVMMALAGTGGIVASFLSK